MNSIFVEAKTWFDKTGGNSYFSARVYVDGKEVARLPFQYGYDSQYRYSALEWLKANGYAKNEASLWHLKEQGVAVYDTIQKAKLSEVKAWGEN